MGEPLVSVVIPTWNRAIEVRQSIASVLEQTYPRIELIVVDDGSTDETPQVLASYGDRIVAIRQDNAGVSAARNAGIRVARGDMLAFLDSDDTWEKTKIEKQVALLLAAGPEAACCLSNAVQVARDGGRKGCFEYAHFKPELREGLLLNPVEIFLTRHILINQNVLIRKQVMERVGLFDEKLMVLEDHDLALRLGMAGPWAYTTESLATIQRDTRHSLTTRANGNDLLIFESLVVIYDKFVELDESSRSKPATAGRRSLSKRESSLARRNLTLTRDEVERLRAGRTYGPIQAFYHRVKGALWARSPLFPNAKVRSLPLAQPN